ncbi:MAG TPA: cytochrome c [Candidatus Bathyarchaeia archaeon]|nr:cytochrome c [Candidatus Bathyarchaeia archaeon]
MKTLFLCICLFTLLPLALAQADQSWKNHVSASDRAKTNPYASQPDAVAAGGRLFADYCAQCHGEDALGRGKRPSLRTPDVQHATDGEIFWILRNGYRWKGMPSWNSLPEASRWQLVTYVKGLGVSPDQPAKNTVPKKEGSPQ